MLIMIPKLFIFAETFMEKSIELNEHSNGTTSTIRVEPNQKITIACFSQGTIFQIYIPDLIFVEHNIITQNTVSN